LKKIPFILYGGDTCHEGTMLGVESQRREDKAAPFIRQHYSRVAYVLLGAGIRPDKPEYLQLKEVTKYNLAAQLRRNFPIITTEKDGWGTFNETLALYDELKRYDEDEIYVCSSWYHLPRILFIWWIISRGTIKIHLVSAWSPRLLSVLKELLSFIKVFYSWYVWKHPA
jgi:hypothetical protein